MMIHTDYLLLIVISMTTRSRRNRSARSNSVMST